MGKCKGCLADMSICQYCIYKDKQIEEKDTNDKKIVYFKNIPDDNTSKKLCPICHNIYTDYPAVSRKDNKTLICSECGQKEALEILDGLSH